MNCKGYKCEGHEVDHLYALGWCIKCYFRHYADTHKEAIIKYQQEYREEQQELTREMNKEYMRVYRKRRVAYILQ